MAENQQQLSAKGNLTLLAGNEKNLDYKIANLPPDTNRFGYTWDVIKKKMQKIVTVNLLMLFCFLPVIAIFIILTFVLKNAGLLGAFGDNLGVGYPASPDNVALVEGLILQTRSLYFALAIPASVIAAAGLAGGIYCARKLLRSDEEVRVLKDFWAGIKTGYLSSLVAGLFAFTMLFICVRVWDFAGYQMALGESAVLYIICRILVCVATAIVLLFALWFACVGSNYKQSVWGIIKNTLALQFGTFLKSLFFAAFAVFPLLILFLFSVDIASSILIVYFCMFGFMLSTLIWCSFNDWVFDQKVNYTAAQMDVQEKEKVERLEQEIKETDVMSLLLAEGKTEYLTRAVPCLDKGTQIYTMPEKFDTNDLKLLAESKQKIKAEAEAYAAEHASDEWYKQYNARFAEREKALVETDKKGKKKKFAPKMLNQE